MWATLFATYLMLIVEGNKMTGNLNPHTYQNLPGVRIFDKEHIENWRGRAMVVSRELVRDIGNSRVGGAQTVHKTLKKPGIYIIWGFAGAQQRPRLYVGYANNCLYRLRHHDKNQSFWTEAAVLTSYIKLEGPRHRKRRRWLEATLLDLVLDKADKGFCTVTNENRARLPSLTRLSERNLRNLVDGFLTCLSCVGLDLGDCNRSL